MTAHPKYPPLTAANFVRFTPPGARRSLLGDVVAPEGVEVGAEIEGDQVTVRAVPSGRLYTVPRSGVHVLHGRALERARTQVHKKPKPAPRPRASRLPGAALAAALLLSPAAPGAGAETRIVYAGPVVLRAVPKCLPPYRSPAYLDHVRSFLCCGCGARTYLQAYVLSDAHHVTHHKGDKGIGQKTPDPGCVPLCRACHRHVTDWGALPGWGKDETALWFLQVSQTLLMLYVERLEWLLMPQEAVHLLAPEQALIDALTEAEVVYA